MLISNLRHKSFFLIVPLAALVAVMREIVAKPRVYESIWAEDGWIPLCVVSRGAGSCTLDQVNGYWPIVHRLIAEPLSLLPMSSWAFLFPLLGAVSTGFFCAVVAHFVGIATSKFTGLLCGTAVVLIPVLGVEFLNVFGNIHWLLLMAALVTITLSPQPNFLSPALLIFLFTSSLSNPAGFVVPGMFLLLVIARLQTIHMIFLPFLVSLLGWAIQVASILVFDGTSRVGSSQSVSEKIDSWANVVVGIVPGVRVVRDSPASYLFAPTRFTSVLVIVITLGLLGRLILSAVSSEIRKRFAVLGMGTQVLTAFLLLILDENPRYTFVLVALNLVWIIGLLGASLDLGLTAKIVLVGLFLVAPLAGFKAGDYRTTPSAVTWQDQLKNAEKKCSQGDETVEFVFAPDRTYVTEVLCSSL